MKKRSSAFARLVGLLLVSSMVLTLSVAASSTAGTGSDPLVTLSYLTDTFLPQILSSVEEKTGTRERALSEKLTEQVRSESAEFSRKYASSSTTADGGEASVFSVITLEKGQTLYGGIGCEVMLRTGSAVCVAASAPGLIDETSGATLSGGEALAKNHLYMITVSDRGVQAGASSTKLLVRGSYSIV